MMNTAPNEMLKLAECEKAFSISAIPIWIADVNTLNFLWTNSAAIDFWHAESVEELYRREMLLGIPDAVVIRVRHAIERILRGEIVAEEWTFFPKGKAAPVMLHLRAIELADGRVAMLNQAVQFGVEVQASALRSLMMIRLSRAPVVFADAAGTILGQNSESRIDFGPMSSWCEWLVRRDVAQEILDDAMAGANVEREVEVQTTHGRQIHAIRAYTLRDPVSGNLGVLIQHADVTERVAAERMVQEHLAKLQDQQKEILALSSPFLDVGAKTVALPLIGHINEARSQEITSRLLDMVAKHGIERVILDITGVVSVDASNLLFLQRLVAAISLLGARPVVTGIRSDLARMLAASDESLSGITIKRSLAEGLAHQWSREPRRS